MLRYHEELRLRRQPAKLQLTLSKDAWNLSKDNKGTFQVTNVKNITQLPLTGAAGTMLFSVIGLLIAGAAVTVFVKSRSTKRALNA